MAQKLGAGEIDNQTAAVPKFDVAELQHEDCSTVCASKSQLRVVRWLQDRTQILRTANVDISGPKARSRERYRRAFLTSGATGLSKVIALAANLISVPLTFRYLGQDRYGIWMVLVSIISVMSFADLGIGNGLMNAVSEASGKQDRGLMHEYVSTSFYLMIGIAAVLCAIGGTSAQYVPWQRVFNVSSPIAVTEGSRAFIVFFFWTVVSIPLGAVSRIQLGLQQGYWPNIVASGGSVLSLLALLVTIKMKSGLSALVFASISGQIISAIVNAAILFREQPWLLPKFSAFRPEAAAHILRLSYLFFVLQCGVAISYTSDNLVIAHVLGANSVPIYSIPQKLFSTLPMLIVLMLGPLWPAYGEAKARGDFAWIRHAFENSMRISLGVALLVSAVLVVAGPLIIKVVVGESLHVPRSLIITLALWGIIYSIAAPMVTLLNGVSILKEQSIVTVVASVCNLLLSVYLTKSFGVIGVCVGSIVAQILIALPVYGVVIKNLFQRMDEQQAH